MPPMNPSFVRGPRQQRIVLATESGQKASHSREVVRQHAAALCEAQPAMVASEHELRRLFVGCVPAASGKRLAFCVCPRRSLASLLASSAERQKPRARLRVRRSSPKRVWPEAPEAERQRSDRRALRRPPRSEPRMALPPARAPAKPGPPLHVAPLGLLLRDHRLGRRAPLKSSRERPVARSRGLAVRCGL